MRALCIARSYPNSANPLAGVMTTELLHALRATGIDERAVHLDERLTWPFNRMKRYRVAGQAEVQTPSWLLRHRVNSLPRAFMIAQRMPAEGRRLLAHILKSWPTWQPTVVHARTIIPSGIVAAELARHFGCPLLISTHGADTREFVNRWTTRPAIVRMCRRADRVVCVSESIRDILIEHGVAPEKLHITYNGMNLKKVHHGPNPLADKYAGRRLIVGVGNLVPCKGYNYLIDAVARLRPAYPNLCLAIVGGGTERAALEGLVRRHHLEDCVELVGPKPPKEAMMYMDACEVFCLPSWSEGFGIVYLEAMASGKAVVAVQGQGITNIVQTYQTGLLVPPHSADGVAAGLKQLLDNPQLARAMGDRGRQLTHEKLTWDACAQEYIRHYSEVIDEYKARGGEA